MIQMLAVDEHFSEARLPVSGSTSISRSSVPWPEKQIRGLGLAWPGTCSKRKTLRVLLLRRSLALMLISSDLCLYVGGNCTRLEGNLHAYMYMYRQCQRGMELVL